MSQRSTGFQRRTLLKTIGVAASAAVAGCGMSESNPNQEHKVGVSTPENPGEGSSSEVARGAVSDAVTVQVTAEDGEKRLDPAIVQTVPGGTVAWENTISDCTGCEDTSVSISSYHTNVNEYHRVPNGSPPFESEKVSQGETFSHTFELPGIYNYFAEDEQGNGMVGIVIVGDPRAVNEPGLAPPQDSMPTAVRDRLKTLIAETKTRLSLPLLADVNMHGTEASATQEFSPQVIRIRPGGAVKFHCKSGEHTATAYHSDNGKAHRVPEGTAAWNSEMLAEGETFTQRFDTEGVYDYYCKPHEEDGMVGTIVVGSPDLDGQPALQPIQGLPSKANTNLTSAHEEVKTMLSAGAGSGGTDDQTGGSKNPSSGDSNNVTVVTSGTSFSPDLISIDVGDSVTWEIREMQHTVTAFEDRIPEGAEAFDSGYVEPDNTFTHTFETAGVYDYYCEPHRSGGMVGTVIVGDPGADQPGLSEPGSDAPSPDALTELNQRTRDELGLSDKSSTDDAAKTSAASNYKFEPEVIKIEKGDTVTWEMESGMHTVTAYENRIPDDAEAFDSGMLSGKTGESFSHTFDVAGVYDYYCSPHEFKGMVGTVVVGTPGNKEPGLSAPSTDYDKTTSKLEELNQTVKDEYGGGGSEGSGSDSSDDDSGGDMTVDEWLSDTSNYDGTKADKTGQDSVTIKVGASGNGSNLAFSPPAVKVDTGTEVTWEWTGNGNHNVVAKDDSFKSGSLQKSGTWSKTFDSDGTYAYYCFPHKGSGMKGVVIVGSGGGIGGSDDSSSGNDSSSDDSGGEMTIDSWLSDTSNYDGSTTDKTGTGSVTIEVGAQGNGGGFAFSPPVVKVDTGTTVTWEWTGSGGGHTVTAKDGSFESEQTGSAGHTFEQTFDSDGTYAYYCSPHEGLGMKGVVIVGKGGSIGGSEREKPDLSKVEIDESLPKHAEVDIVKDDWPKFTPRIVHIRRGGTVTWNWASGDMPHSVSMNSARSPENGFKFGTSLQTEPHTYENKFWMEGVFQYFCLVPEHKAMMKAVVIVGNPDPSEEPALEPVDESKPGAETMAELIYDTKQYLNGNASLAQVNQGAEPDDFQTSVGDPDNSADSKSFDNVDTSLPEAVDVGIPSDEFEPRIVHVRKGGTVTWHWDDGPHSVTANSERIPDGASHFASDMEAEGSTFTHTFNTAGVYSYYCIYDGHMDDMTGMVIVGDPDPNNQPALDPVEAGEPGYEELPDLIDQVESILNNYTTAQQSSSTSDSSGSDSSGSDSSGSGNTTQSGDSSGSSHNTDRVDSLTLSVTEGTPQQGETITLQLTGDGSPVSGVEVRREKPSEQTYTTDDNGEITVTLSGGEDFRFEADHAGESARKEWEFDG
jgi:halocyanin-like protein